MFTARKCLLLIAAIVVIFGAQQLAQADPLVLTIQNNSVTGVAGGSVTFFASVTNTGITNTNTVTIVSIGGQLPPGFSADYTAWEANFRFQQVASGASLGPQALLTLTIVNLAIPDGSYSGNIVLRYLSGASTTPIETNIADFTVRVGAATAPVPEPTTMLLLGTGLVGIAAKVRKRRKAV